ncbi:hypothetical protein HRK28_09595 [Rathayibacter sp. VKM Ac-2835]|uniref:hypothetical protein n=1 Tax=Rathayibacter sp. VKM Ac-2835 TaxID=2739043 RepID=UPI001567124C|nr:hypothetical protein [Rathayibacter sp. VKM Ac-2835]NRG41175.1 hypothetical protein [Rathayibacter sp. VKM Ac-2835]
MDFHEDIHRVVENYFDENEFRRYLNSAIQNSRGVTFLLQKKKDKWSDFDEWYGAWQDRARKNPVLGWGVTARNRIVKEEDLATLSQARVGVYDTHRLGYEDAFAVPPSASPEMLIAAFQQAQSEDHKSRKGWIRVERRWVDDQLPDYELVAALREMYYGVAEIIERAHAASGVADCAVGDFNRDCVTSRIDRDLHCLGPGNPASTTILNLETGKVAQIGFLSYEYDKESAPAGIERYGQPPKFSGDPISHADDRMKLSKQFLRADGYAGPILMLFGEGRGRLFPVPFNRDDPREVHIAAIVESVGAWQFDGAIYSSEMWLGYPGSKGMLVGAPPGLLLPSNQEVFDEDLQGGRDEALIVVGLTSDGRHRVLAQPFGRAIGGYIFGPLLENELPIPEFLRPLWDRWPSAGDLSAHSG